jgi:hypothetical protein
LAVVHPASIVSARSGGGVNTGAVFRALVSSVTESDETKAVVEITYKNVESGDQWQDADAHFTMWVSKVGYGKDDKGRVRLRKNSSSTKLYPAECTHIDFAVNDYLTVYAYVDPTVRYPLLKNTEGLSMRKDWDIAYSDQNEKLYPIAIMGPTGATFINNGTATIPFDGSNSYGMGGATISSWSWVFPSGTPASSSAETPGDVTWSDDGQYLCKFTVTDSNGKTTTTYRIVFVFDWAGDEVPYTRFQVQNCSADVNQMGWQAGFEIFGDADIAEFPDLAMVVLFTEEWYGTTLRDFGGNHDARHNIRYVGWVVKGTTTKDPDTSIVRFDTRGPLGVLDQRENFSVAIRDVDGSPNRWWKMKDMTVRRIIHHMLYWHTTLFFMTDVYIDSGGIFSRRVFGQDFARATLVQAVRQFMDQAHVWWGADRAGCLFFNQNPQLLAEPDDDPAPRNAVGTVMKIEHQDWVDRFELPREQTRRCNFLYVDGVYYPGGGDQDDADLFISYAPGRAPAYFGRNKTSKGHILPSTQSEANKLAGLLWALENNPLPNVPVPLAGNYVGWDIVPALWTTMDLVAADTRRGYEWTDQRLLLSNLREEFDNEAGTIKVTAQFAKEAYGPPGVTGDYPPDDPPEPPPEVVPPAPPFPADTWDGPWLVGVWLDGTYPIMRTDRLDGSYPTSPTWYGWSTGMATNWANCSSLRRDPWNPSTRLYAVVFEDVPWNYRNHAMFRREYSGGSWGIWELILDESIVESVTGKSLGYCWFWRAETNINIPGALYTLAFINYWDGGIPGYRGDIIFLKSLDYGDSWSYSLVKTHSNPYEAFCFPARIRAGMLQGTSGYGAGSVIYVGFQIATMGEEDDEWEVYRSTNGGTSWSFVCGLVDPRGGLLSIDPNDQSIFFTTDTDSHFNCGGGAKTYRYWDHGDKNEEETAWSGYIQRPPVPRIEIPNRRLIPALTKMQVSYDGGETVEDITVDGEVAGFGGCLNWNYGRLLTVANVCSQTVKKDTRIINTSPDGGITWRNKHGNFPTGTVGLISVGFPVED